MSATNRPIEVVGILFSRFRDGKMVEARVVWDAAGLYSQLGIVPMAAPA
jgi:hypothetical protein